MSKSTDEATAETQQKASETAPDVQQPQTVPNDPPPQGEGVQGSVDPGDEMVTVELFYDGDKYKDPVPVIVNGIKIEVPRGKPVKIKRKYAEVLQHSMEQNKAAGKMQDRLAAEFAQETKTRGLTIE